MAIEIKNLNHIYGQDTIFQQYALKNVHSPKSMPELENARRRLIFEELLTLQVGMRMLKDRDRGKTELIIRNELESVHRNDTSEYEQ